AAHFDRYRAHDSVRALFSEGKLTNRIWINFLHLETDPQTPELMARLLNAWNNFGDDMVRVVGIGEFTAGPFLEPGTPQWFHGTRLVADAGWRLENHSLNFPAPLFPPGPPDWKVIIDGWQKVHNDVVAAGNPEGITQLRWVLAHVPSIDEEHLTRLKNLGGGINVLGGWRWLSGTAAQNGPQFRLLLASGIPLGMSSDGMQISVMSPWINLYYVVTGKNALGQVINGDQTLPRNEAPRLYTANNGWFLHAENKLGTIEEGKPQDHSDSLRGSLYGSRRNFLKATAASGVAAAGLNLFGARPAAAHDDDDDEAPSDSGRGGRRYVIRGGAVMSMDPKVGD